MTMRIAIAIALAALLAAPAAASAVTPGNATKLISKCMKHHAGALAVSNHGTKGGKAYFKRPFDSRSTHYVQWGYYFVDSGQVKATWTASLGLTKRQERAVNRCLKPFNGSV